jgi:hypothetical protein
LDSIFHLLIESTSNGTKELWTNADLIHKEQQLWDLIQNSSNPVWVIAGSDKNDRNDSIKAISHAIEERYSRFVAGGSADEKMLVYRVIPENVD